jgi:hypothetical protein
MATAAEWQQLRDDLGHSITTLTDVEAEALYARATVSAPNSIGSTTRVLGILQLLGSASKLHDYVQNNSSESSSQVFKNLQTLLAIWQGRVTQEELGALAALSTARFGRTRRKSLSIYRPYWP